MAIGTQEARERQQAEAQGNISRTIQDVTERTQTLVREEIELAKAELTEKGKTLGKGAAVGIAAGVFAVFGLLLFLHGLAWLIWYVAFPDNTFFWGFFIVAALLFLVGALAGYIASRALKKGTPPTPEMAMTEAKLIRETVSSPHPEKTV
jgi:uncharacterized membrane protein YqjE